MELAEELTLGGMLRNAEERFPERPAITYHDKSFTYRQFGAITDRCARIALAMGIGRRTHTAVWAESNPYMMVILFALLRIGAIPILVGGCRSARELLAELKQSDAEFLLYDDAVRGVRARDVLPAGEEDLQLKQSSFFTFGHANVQSSEDALHEAEGRVRAEDVDFMLFTSGTSSGRPKAVVTTHRSRVNVALAQSEMIRADENDRFCVSLPMFHCFALTGIVLSAISVGACMCFPDSIHSEAILRCVEKDCCTVLNSVPTMFSAMLARRDFSAYDLRSLRCGLIGGSVYTREFFREVNDRFGFVLLPSLGQTEATAGYTGGSLTDDLERRSACVGKLFPHIRVEIRDMKTGRPLPAGERGEICVSGYNVMQGYYKQEDETRRTLESGWLHTGDVGYMGANGYLYMTGRLKEVIIRGGENISPMEVEAVILSDSRVRAAKLVGVPDPHYIEEICACVCTDGSITAEEIRQMVRRELAPFKVPRYVLFMDSLPTTQTGKINLAALADTAKKALGL